MEVICRLVATFFVNALWQVALIALAAALAARVIRRAPAHYVHILWLCALGLSILLPLWSTRNAWRPRQESSRQGTSIVISVPGPEGGAHGTAPKAVQGPAVPTGRTVFPVLMHGLHRRSRSLPLGLFWIDVLVAGYGLSLAAALIRFARCWIRTRSIRRQAYRRALPPQLLAVTNHCANTLGIQTPRILLSSSRTAPLTLGALHPVIVFPDYVLGTSSDGDLTAAFAHELAHVRRRDYLVNLVCELGAVLAAFHPGTAFIKRHIARTRELACDETASAVFPDAPAYAHSLVRIARAISTAPGAPGYSLGVFDADLLEERVMRLLETRRRFSVRITAVSVLGVSVLLAAAALAAYGFSFTPGARGQFAANAPESGPQQTPLRGTVYDPSGARLPGAAVVLRDDKTGQKWNRTTGDTGDFRFDHLGAGRYSLTIQKPGFALYTMTLFRVPEYPLNVVLEVGGVLQSVVVTAKAPARPRTPKVIIKAPMRIRVGGSLEVAKLVKLVRPVYPESARQQDVQGTVTLEAVISKRGIPLSVKVLASPNPALATAARDAVQQWRYQPTLLNGQPIEVVTTISLLFRLVH